MSAFSLASAVPTQTHQIQSMYNQVSLCRQYRERNADGDIHLVKFSQCVTPFYELKGAPNDDFLNAIIAPIN